MSKVSTKTDQALASSSSGSQFPVPAGTATVGAAASRPRTTPRPPKGATSFSTHLENAHHEQAASGPQDHAPPSDASAPASKTASHIPAGNHARHMAAQNTAQPAATDVISSQTTQTAGPPTDPSTASPAKKAKSGLDTTIGSTAGSDQPSQSLLADILSQAVGLQQKLAPTSSQDQARATGQAGMPTTATPSSPPSSAVASTQTITAAATVAPNDPTIIDQNAFATVLAQIPDSQQTLPPATLQLSTGPGTLAATGQPPLTAASAQSPNSLPATQSPAGTPTATGQSTSTVVSAQTPNRQLIQLSVSPQPSANTAAATGKNVPLAAPAQIPDSPQVMAVTLAQTPDSQQIPASPWSQSPTDGTGKTGQALDAGTAPTIAASYSISGLTQSSFQTAPTAANSRNPASRHAASVQEDIATAATTFAPGTSTASVQQTPSANQTAQHHGPAVTALPLSPDNSASSTSGLPSLPDGTDGSAAPSDGHNGTSGHPDSTSGNQDKASAQASLQTATNLTLPPGLSPFSSFATTLNAATSQARAAQIQKEVGASPETGNQTVSSASMTQSTDGSTSLSLTILTDDSTPVHVRVEGTDGLTTGIILQSEDQVTARHLADNRHELIAALTAAGVDVSNLKVDVVANNSNNSDTLQNPSQNADNTNYNGSSSGNMFGSDSGQNSQQSYAGSSWSANDVTSREGIGDAEAQNGSHSMRSSSPHAGSGINITA